MKSYYKAQRPPSADRLMNRRWRPASATTPLLALLFALLLLHVPSARATTSAPITNYFRPVAAEQAAAQLVDAPRSVPTWHGTIPRAAPEPAVTADAEQLARRIDAPGPGGGFALPVERASIHTQTPTKKRKREKKVKKPHTNEIETKLQRLQYTAEECQTIETIKQRIHEERMMTSSERKLLQPRITFKDSGISERIEYIKRLVASRGLFLLSTPEQILAFSGNFDHCKVCVQNADKADSKEVRVTDLRTGDTVLETIDEQTEAFVNSIILRLTDDEKKQIFEQSKIRISAQRNYTAARKADDSVEAKLFRKQAGNEKKSEAHLGRMQQNAKEGVAMWLLLNLLQRISETGSFKYDTETGIYSMTVDSTKDRFEFAPIFDGLEADLAMRHVNAPDEARRDRWIPIQIKSGTNTLGVKTSFNFGQKPYINVYCIGIGMLNYETNEDPKKFDDITPGSGETQIGEIWDIGDNVGYIGPTFGLVYKPLAQHKCCFVSRELLHTHAPDYLNVEPFLLQMLENIKHWQHAFSLDTLHYDFSSGQINAAVSLTHQIEKKGFKTLSAALPGLRPPWRQNETVDTVWKSRGVSNKTASRMNDCGTFFFKLKVHPNHHFADWILAMYTETNKVAVMEAAAVYGLESVSFSWNESTGHNMHLVRIFNLDDPADVEKLRAYLLTKQPQAAPGV